MFVLEPETNAGKCKGVECWPTDPSVPYKALEGGLLQVDDELSSEAVKLKLITLIKRCV